MTKPHGFTLIEMMITLVLAAILLALAVPSFTQTVRDNQLTTRANQFLASLALARSEAVKSGRPATVCVSDNQATCNGTNWAAGWIVWIDTNGSGALDAGELRQTVEPLPASMTFTSLASTFRFTAQGSIPPGTGSTLDLCDDRAGETGRRITVTNTGRANIKTDFGCT